MIASTVLNVNPATIKGRLDGLEVVRGLAAISIVIFHLAAIYVPVPAGPMFAIVHSLSGAVPIFFAVSAFSLLYGYSEKLFDNQILARFYIRRIFRIFPLFYLMLALYILLKQAMMEFG